MKKNDNDSHNTILSYNLNNYYHSSYLITNDGGDFASNYCSKEYFPKKILLVLPTKIIEISNGSVYI